MKDQKVIEKSSNKYIDSQVVSVYILVMNPMVVQSLKHHIKDTSKSRVPHDSSIFWELLFQTWIHFQAFFIHPQKLTTEPKNKASTGELDRPLPGVIFRLQSLVFWEVPENKASAEQVKLGVQNREHAPQNLMKIGLLLQKEARSSSVFNHQFSGASY